MNIQIVNLSVTVIATILLPIVFKLLPEKKQSRKKEQIFSDDLEFSELFCEIVNDELPLLVKDRATQKLIHRKNISFGEAKFFYNFRNMESIILDYIDVRKYLKLTFRNNELYQINTIKYARVIYIVDICFYSLYLSIAMSPLLFWDFYHYSIAQFKISNDYLIVYELYVYPYFFLICAIIKLFRTEQANEAIKFVKKLKEHLYLESRK